MSSDYRVIIGVPADSLVGKDSERVLHRRARIIEIVEAHVERMAETSTNLAIDSIEYSFITSLEFAFKEIFPLHTLEGARTHGLDAALPTPALRLTNVMREEQMQPDWPVLLAELPAELDRLVGDFERWQSSTDALVPDPTDGVVPLHNRNLAAALGGARHLVTLFYAPWCHYSQLMLPKFAKARALVGELKGAGLVEKRSVGLAKVNVDQEGDLKAAYGVQTYPDLQTLSSGGNRARAARLADAGAPVAHAAFGGDSATSADMAAHAVSRHAWPGGFPYAILAPSSSLAVEGGTATAGTSGNATVAVGRYAAVLARVDAWLAAAHVEADAAAAAVAEGGDDDDGLLAFEPKRAVVALAVFPEGASGAAVAAATAALARLLAGKNVFVAACHGPAAAAELLPLLPGGVVASAAEAGALAAAAAAGDGHLVVAKPGDGAVLDHPFPPTFASALAAAAAATAVEVPPALAHWAVAATWPLVSRFDPSAAQGERIRSGPVKALCVLVGDEADFMFEDFRLSLAAASRQRTGAAHFLFADQGEPRIAPLLRAAGADPAAGGPVVVVVSMERAFAPAKLEGAAISADAIGALLDRTAGAGAGAGAATVAKEEL